jgi:hypothetical protein
LFRAHEALLYDQSVLMRPHVPLCLENVYGVLLIFWIARHERQPFDLRLRDHDSIERISVNIRRPADGEGMRRGNI